MITLEFLCGQEMTEEIMRKLDRAIDKAHSNILDAETSEKDKRVVTLKITLTPYFDMDRSDVLAEVKTKTAQERPIETFFKMNPDQLSLDDIDQETGEVAHE